MKSNKKNIFLTCFMAAFLLGLSLWGWLREPDEFSDSERRVLAAAPELSIKAMLSGDYMEDFETYAQDQFPLRDNFRSLKAFSTYYLFGQLDNNDIYLEDGHASRLLYPLNENMLDYAAERFLWIYDNYLADKDMNIYFSIIPDKNYYLAEENGYLSLDYQTLIDTMREKTGYMEYIDITDLLSIDDYYRTDTHWRQEELPDVAERLAEKMGITLSNEYAESSQEYPSFSEYTKSSPEYSSYGKYQINTLEYPFYGVYCGQSALPLKPDTIKYLTSDILDDCIVTSYDTGMPIQKYVYDMEKAAGRDPYEMFMSGSDALLTVENPHASSERELILFRDSFGSSLAPLLVEGYSKITMVDIRYIQSAMLGNFIEFEDQDVLFMYSTLLLNDSLGLR